MNSDANNLARGSDGARFTLRATSILGQQDKPLGLHSKGGSQTTECRDVHHIRDHATAHDICLFVKTNCDDEQPGLIPYLTLYYCTFFYARIAGFTFLITWLGLLFSTIGIAASDFFTPNLQTIAGVLSMPENLTGVTFLAVGNGSPTFQYRHVDAIE
ncbi:unnamed protein product [Parascedosporium putredinis]|uniref:Uncharacterized protein n=1 Tax=Parascedosporium putredinis TaxID=1442378 RepID=A0A9P1H5W1_9PEZI|nr:unnamed protein product [Parascedosporium putredinis]CAI7998177.1 unnamed protein product [Parascedosporium putredinis]